MTFNIGMLYKTAMIQIYTQNSSDKRFPFLHKKKKNQN